MAADRYALAQGRGINNVLGAWLANISQFALDMGSHKYAHFFIFFQVLMGSGLQVIRRKTATHILVKS